MSFKHELKRMKSCHHMDVKDIYIDAITSIGPDLYTNEQIHAWSSLACLPKVFDRLLIEGKGWISFENEVVAAFALRHPINRLALLYCRGKFSRQGHASSLLHRIEIDAYKENQSSITTEASFFSYKLLLKKNWHIIGTENIEIGGVPFQRYRMFKHLI